MLGLLASLAGAQPANDSFTNAIAISGPTGTISGTNNGASLDACELSAILFDDLASVTNSVWYAWTAPEAGTVTFNTVGSGFDTVLAVYRTASGLCAATEFAADHHYTNSLGILQTNSQVSFTAVAGKTYYVSVNGNAAADPTNDAGTYVLNWNLATVVSGNFLFTSDTAQGGYTVSANESASPTDPTVSPSWLGARVTVTRLGGANGRATVNYTIGQLTYTNIFYTNVYGTNFSVTYTDTNTPPNISTTNVIETFTVYTNLYGYFAGGYQQYPIIGALTNTIVQIFTGITPGAFTTFNLPPTNTGLVPIPTKFPVLTNYFTTNVVATGLSTNITIANIFSGPNVTNLVSGTLYATNYYGTNLFVSYAYIGGAAFYTNLFYTNVVVFSNSVALWGTNYFSGNGSNDVGAISIANSGSGVYSPLPTNLPPVGVVYSPIVTVTNTDGSVTVSTTNSFSNPPIVRTRIVPSASGGAGGNTLTFDDYQMSADITVPIAAYAIFTPDGTQLPTLLSVTLTNAQLDPLESADLIPPTIDPAGGSSFVSILNNNFVVGATTNYGGSVAVFNFERADFRVNENVNGGNAVIYVTRTGDTAIACSVSYEIDYNGGANLYHTFPLQAGSDYAIPNTDFTSVTGTLSFPAAPAAGWDKQAISIPIINDGLVKFNEDMIIQLYGATPTPPTVPFAALGTVNTATLTILFDNSTVLGGLFPGQQPAGAVDRSWNKDGANDSIPPFISYPGTSGGVSDSANGNGGTVYAVAEQPDGNAIVAGSFVSYDSNPYNRIVRVLNNGYQDPSFLVSPNSGANDFISSVVLQPDGRIIIGGNFTSFNGYNRHHIARLNADGSVDTTFNPGLGVNGANAIVWSIALQSNGQIVIAGDFSSVNGTNINSVARLNANGSLDTSFNPGIGPDGTVNAVVVDANGRVIIGGDFDTVSGINSGGVARLNVDGSLDSTFAIGIGTYNSDTGFTDPVNALALQPNGQLLVGGGFSYLDLNSYNGIVRLNTDGSVDSSFNPGTGTYNFATGISDSIYNITLQPDGNILIGGDFTTFNQTRRVGVARLFSYGSLDTSFMDTAYNQFAGIPNHYHNPNANNTALYPQGNQRNYVYSMALQADGNIIMGGGFLRVGGGNTRDDIHPRSNVARLIGGTTPGPGNIQFSYGSYSVDKDGGQLYVSLVRANGNLGIASATFATNMPAPGPGIASATDFTPLETNPTWDMAWSANAWMRSSCIYGVNYASTPVDDGQANVYLQINNNTNITGNENANLLLTAPVGTNFFLGGQEIPVGTALGSQSTAPLTIIDDNIQPGIISFAAPQFSVIESGGTATITVVRNSGSDGVVQVSYFTSNGTATNGVDYTGITNTLTFSGGQTSQTFTVPIINGTTVRPDRVLNLTLFNATGGATLGQTNATLTIINGNFTSGHITLSSPVYGANENAGFALLTLNRVGGSSGVISVTAITSDGTAVNGVNYVGSTNTYTWNNTNAVPQTISVPLIDDGVVTPNLTFNLRLTNGVLNSRLNANVLGLSQFTNAVVTITNVDSAGTVQFSSSSYSVKKYGGFALIPVVRIGGSAQTVTVNYNTYDITATNGVDYVATNGQFTFPPGIVSTNFLVQILNTNLNTGLLKLGLSLTNANPTLALGSISNAVLNIIDTSTVNETPGSPDTTYYAFGFNNTVYALALQVNNQLLVGGDFTLADGVPRQRIARLNSNGTLDNTFSLPSTLMGANSTVRAIAVQADGRILLGGSFTTMNNVNASYLARLNANGTLDSLFNPGSGADNPVYALAETFVNGQSKVLVGGAFASLNGTSYNGIARLNTDGSPDTAFNPGLGANATVYALAVQPDGKVVIGGDFTAVNGNTNYNHIARLNTDGSLDTSFNSGTGASDSVRAITLQSDGRILIGGLFTSVNGTPFNHVARLNSNGSVDATFAPGLGADDAVFSIALQMDSRIVLGGEFTHCSGVTRSRITRLNPDGTVDPTINFGYGANNFISAVAIQEDTIAGYPTNVLDEKIVIGGGFTQYDNQSHPYLARIYGGSIGGPGAFEFTSANYSADENSTNVIITILRTGGTSGTNGLSDVLVPFTTSDGTGVANVNYLAVATNLDFPVGEVLRTVVVPVLDDHLITPNLTVNLSLDPVPPAQYGDQPTATLTIINDDSSISLSAANYQVAKNIVSGVAAISIVRQGSVNGTSTVNFSTTGLGTAVSILDYTPVSNTVTFAPGVSNVVVAIPINNNGIVEGNRTVTMQLANATGSVLYSPTNATLTIVDTVNAAGLLSFASPNYVITEGGTGYTNAYITVVRSFGSAGTITVNFSTVDGTALAGTKYVSTNGTLTFGDGETAKTFPVQVVNDLTAEGPESLSIVLSNPTGGAGLFSPTNTILTILNTNTGIAFVAATNYISEPSGVVPASLVLNVVRYNNTNGITTVQYATSDGTASAATNYTATSGTLTFTNGQSLAAITVPILHDPRVTGDLNFSVSLSLPSGGAQLTPPSTTTVIIHDADAGISLAGTSLGVLKNGGNAVIPVLCSNPNVEPVSVHYSTGPGTAKLGIDYKSASGVLTFTNGQTVAYFSVPIIPNNLVESNLNFTVSLSSPTAPGVLVAPTTETVTIIETNSPYGLSFFSPLIISGIFGSTNVDNTPGLPESGDPNIAGFAPSAPVWLQWVAPADGEVTLDTIGSYDTNGVKLDTVLAVFTGTSLSSLSQVAANDDLYPLTLGVGQYNESAQNIFNTNSSFNPTNLVLPTAQGSLYNFTQPYGGPSGLRFNAKAGTTYYIAADTKAGISGYVFVPYPPYIIFTTSGRGPISINWAYHSAGVFRFATENVDQTGVVETNGQQMLLYQCAETESSRRFIGTVDADKYSTTLHSYYNYDAPGLLVTVTRVAGSSGRVLVDYTTVDGNTNLITNGDSPAVAFGTNNQVIQIGPNTFITNNASYSDYTSASGTLVFDDYEMSKTILIPITDDYGIARPNRDFTVVLSNPRLDPAESGLVSPPRVDKVFGQALCRILDCDIDPREINTVQTVNTNVTPAVTNLSVSIIATNPVFNFQKANYRVSRDVQSAYWHGTPVTVYVTRTGTNTSAATLYYRIDGNFLDKSSADEDNIYFPLQPGSDYATPFTASPPLVGGIYGSTNFDFNPSGGASGTLTFPQDKTDPQPISFNVLDNNLTEFNKDIHIVIYAEDSKGNPYQVGMVAETTVTILFDDISPPAGSVDELYNPDFAVDLALPVNSYGSAVGHPGTEASSEVYSLVLTTNNQTIIGGAFSTYTDGNNTYTVHGLARLNFDGSLDTTFSSGAGVNVFPGGEFIRAVALTANNQILIGGHFTSYNGVNRPNLARLNANGSLDTTFTPGGGANGTVWAVQPLPNGQVMIGGDFTAYNSIPCAHIARINADGSFDSSFNPGTNINGSVYAIALLPNGNNQVVIGGAFTSVGGTLQNNIAQLLNDGSLDTSFNAGTGPNNAVRSLAIQPDGKIVAGGQFTVVAGQTYNRLVRFNTDGSVDANFTAGTGGADGTIYSITLQTNNGTMYIGGAFTEFNGTHRLGFARLYGDGTVDTTFMDTAYNQFAGLPRIYYGDVPGTVYSSGIQTDGNVMISGSFAQVGGGQFDENVRPGDYGINTNLLAILNPNIWPEPKSRDGVRNRGNVARLIGGGTPGPGNIGMAANNYAANKTQSFESVTLVRTNGSLGYASANFAVQSGLAQSGLDYSYGGVAPLYPIEWEYEGPTRLHSDGLLGPNGLMNDPYLGLTYKFGLNGPAAALVSIINNTTSSGNLNATFQMANPSGADQFYLGGQNIPLGVALGTSVAPLTVVDNSHQDGVFGFSAGSFTANSSTAAVGITRTGSSSGTVQLSYTTTTNGTALVGTDYRATNGLVTFNPGQTNSSFALTILGNGYIASVEKTVGVQLYNLQDLSSGNAALGLSNALVRIINPNFAGYLNFSTNSYSANVSAGVMPVTVTRTVGSQGTLTVQYATANGTAVNGVDYVGATNTLTWNNGDVTPRTINISLINSNTVGANKQFFANLSNPTLNGTNTPSLLGATATAVLNIVNDNSYGTFQFSAPSYLVNENGGYATVTVSRSGSGLGTASVSYSTANGTASAGINYIPTNGVLAFAQGQLSRSFTVRILDDGKTNPPPSSFYFNVALANVTAGATLGSPTNSTVNIVDAETYNQPPGSSDSAFDPSAGMNGSVFALALQSDGQIVAGGNFTIANGSPINRIARLNTDGTLDTSFLNGLSGADGAINALISQTDDRIVVGGAFANIDGIIRSRVARLMTDGSLDTSFNPGSGADNTIFSLFETFINGSRELYVGGAFSTINGTASPGVARLNNDGSVDTSFAVGLGAGGPVYAVAAYPTNSVNNAGKVLVGGAFTNFNNIAVGNLVRLNADGSVDTNFNVTIGTDNAVRAITIESDDSVLIGGDFANVNGTSLNHVGHLNANGSVDSVFATNLGAGANGTVNSIVVQPDNRIVLVGDFTQASGVSRNSITRLLPTGAVDPTINFGSGANNNIYALVLQPTDGMMVIGGDFTQFNGQEHDYIDRVFGGSVVGSGAFEFTSANYFANENGGYAVIGISRTGGTSGTNADGTGDVFVTFATADNTAIAGTNYFSIVTNLDFPAGQTYETVLVPLIDDMVITSNLTVNLSLTNPTPPAGYGNQSGALLTIINTDSALRFLSTSYSVPKNTVNGVATIDIIRQGSTSGSCSVNFLTTTNGTALTNVDYYPTNVTVTFNPGDSDKTALVPIINNTIPEGFRTVSMQLSNAVGSLLYSPSNATLTIIDTVYSPGQLYFASTNYTFSAGNTNAYLTVLRTNGSSGAVSVTFTTVAGTAKPGQDYIVPTSTTLAFGDGVTSNSVVIPLINNSLVQAPVSLSVMLSNPTGGAQLINPTNTTLTIVSANTGVSFVSGTNYVSESTNSGLIFVQRIGVATNAFTVNYATADGTARAGINYVTTSGTLAFAGGEVLKTVSVPLINNHGVTNLAFSMTLSTPSAGVQLAAPSNSVVIIQPSMAGLSFTNPAMSVSKNVGLAVITVVCSNPSIEPVASSNSVPLSVSYFTSDGTAIAGQDYTTTSGTLVFTNGIGTNFFTVPIINSGLITGNRTFTVSLTNATAPGVITIPGSQVVTIVDNNSGLSFSAANYTILKTGVATNITVVRTDNTNLTSTVNFSTADGTAVAGTDYVATNGVLTFTNGETSHTFALRVIATTTVQPDKTVLLQLSTPTNGILTAPSAAILTIRDNSGSLVVPAGSALLSESLITNGIIDPNETVKMLFAFRVSAGTNIANLTATLLATNGINSPTPSGPVSYGPLIARGPSASQAFTFTANGTNGQNIAATFQLANGSINLGQAAFTYTLGTWTNTFVSTNAIIINDLAPASPYPSTIVVSNVNGVIVKATVTLTNLYHTYPNDIDALVVSPGQKDTLIMAHAGGGNAIGKVTLTFDDAATNSLPPKAYPQTTITNGTYKPTSYLPIPSFP